ncbi:MAG: CoA pyrophosphatase [Bacteroidetes bacterium]|nr:CoA pyrophosphatase [Bacteroidota bacterium]
MQDNTIERLKERLLLPLPGIEAQNKMAARVRELPSVIPDDARLSAVMALLFPKNDELNLLLIKRVNDGRAHGGQIAFPGGRKEDADTTLQDTALRETFEEVGIPAEQIEVLGSLTSLYIPVSYSMVHPYVGYLQQPPEPTINPSEVQYVFDVPLKEFFVSEKKIITHITPLAFPDITIKAPAYQWDADHLVWGATAMIIAELEALIEGL